MKMEECKRKRLLRPHSFPKETIEKEMKNARRHLDNAERNFEFEMMDVSIVYCHWAKLRHIVGLFPMTMLAESESEGTDSA